MAQRRRVSALTWWLTVCSGLTWVAHNLRHDEPVAALANGWSALTARAILVRYYRDSTNPNLVTAVTVPLLVGVADVAAVVIEPDALGWIAAGIGMVMFLPQALSVFTESDVSGVSIGTWCVAVVASLLWGTYGVLHRDPAVVAPPVLTGSLPLAIVCRLIVARRRSARNQPRNADGQRNVHERSPDKTGVDCPPQRGESAGGRGWRRR